MQGIKIFVFVIIQLISSALFANVPHIQDDPKILSSEMTTKLEDLLTDIETKKQLRIEVVILNSFNDLSEEAVANAFYEQMDKNSPDINQKVLLLLATDRNYANIFPSVNLSSIYTPEITKDIVANVSKKLTEKNYDDAARVGIAGIYHYFDKNTEKPSALRNFGTILFNLIFVGVVIYILFLVIRKRKTSPKV